MEVDSPLSDLFSFQPHFNIDFMSPRWCQFSLATQDVCTWIFVSLFCACYLISYHLRAQIKDVAIRCIRYRPAVHPASSLLLQ